MRAVVLLLLVVAVGLGLYAWLEEEPGPLPERPVEPPAGAPGSADAVPGTGASIYGQVLRAGIPIPARVELLHVTAPEMSDPVTALMDTRRELVATQHATGDYRFPGLEPGRYCVQAVAGDGALGMATAVLTDTGEDAEADLSIPAGPETLTVRAVYADDRAFSGFMAVVPDSRERDALFGGAVVQADAEGRVVFSGLQPGPVNVRLEDPGRLLAITAAVTLPREGELLLVLDEGLVPVSGRVISRSDDSPVAGAAVRIASMSEGFTGVILSVRTDGEGRFKARGGERGGVGVTADGYVPFSEKHRSMSEEILVRLDPTATITGIITADGKPVSGVDVFARPQSQRPFHSPSTAKSGADGWYTLTNVMNGAVMVYALGGGYASKGLAGAREQGANPFLLKVEPGEQCELDLEVEPAATIVGQVKEAVEDPVFRQASVTVEVADGGWAGWRGRGMSQPTDHDGRFEFSGLVPGLAYQLSAKASDSLPATSSPQTVGSGEQVTVNLSYPPSRSLKLTVLEEGTGLPIEGAVVKVSLGTGSRYHGLPGEWRTDATGIARIRPMPLGLLMVEATSGDHVEMPAPMPMPDSEKGDFTFTLHLEKGIRVSGRVFRPDGSPFGREQLRVRRVEPKRGLTVLDRTAADGGFSVGGLTPGLYEFTVSYPVADPPICRVRVDADASDLTVRLKASPIPESEPRPEVQVRIVDAVGQPVPEGRIITWKHTSGSISTSSAGFRDGLFDAEIEDDAEEFWLVVYDAKDRDGKRLEWLVHGPSKPGPATLTLTLRPALAISGTVVDAKGKAVRGVEVRARPAPGRLPFGWDSGMRSEFATCHSGRDGTFRVEGLGTGEYELVITPSRDFAPHEPVAASGGAEGVRVSLVDGVTANLRVLDWSEKPVAGAQVAALAPVPGRDDRWTTIASGTTGQDGRVTLSGLDPTKSYRLHAGTPRDRLDLKACADPAWLPAGGSLRMSRAYVVRGVVRTSAGKPVPGLTVWQKAGTGWSGLRTEEDGTFLITDLDAGPVVLRPEDPYDESGRFGGVTVQAGDEDVVLIYDP